MATGMITLGLGPGSTIGLYVLLGLTPNVIIIISDISLTIVLDDNATLIALTGDSLALPIVVEDAVTVSIASA